MGYLFSNPVQYVLGRAGAEGNVNARSALGVASRQLKGTEPWQNQLREKDARATTASRMTPIGKLKAGGIL